MLMAKNVKNLPESIKNPDIPASRACIKYQSGPSPPMETLTASSQDQRRMYGDLAWLWPILSTPKNYVSEAEFFVKLITKHSAIPVKTILHLGCGAGHIDWTLKKHFSITGVDLNGAMLALARRLNPDVRYRQGDMRTVRLRRMFDAVVIADSMTYMLSEADLKKAFATAWTHLRPGGIFCTYAEQTKEFFEQNKTKNSRHARGDIEVTFIENTFDPDPRDTTCVFTFVFLIGRAGKVRVETDHHLAGLFRIETWLRLLRKAGFEVTQVRYPGETIPTFVCAKPRKP